MARSIAFLLVLIASPALGQQTIDLPYGEDNWSTAPGEWAVPYEVRPSPFLDECLKAEHCTSFAAKVRMNVPTCLRWLNPQVIQDGREISGHVTESGTPGEPDWEWSFETDELFTGPFIWKVKTIDVCPKVG